MDEKKISDLANQFVESVKLKGGKVALNPGEDEDMRLLVNGVDFTKLSLGELCTSLATSSLTVSPVKNISYTHADHIYMWSWCAQIIAHDTEYFSMEEMNLKELVRAIVHAAKAHKHHANHPKRENYDVSFEGAEAFAKDRWEAMEKVALPSTVEQYLSFQSHIVSYLSFPLLEGVLKKRCSEYIGFDGEVKKEFSISSIKKPFGKEKMVSNLGVLLFLYFELVASEFEKKHFSLVIDHLKGFSPEKHPFWMIFDWRNQALHGQRDHQTVGGVLLSMSLLIAIASLGDRFDALRDKSIILAKMPPPSIAPSALYPPVNR
jgi:hypothetical protein